MKKITAALISFIVCISNSAFATDLVAIQGKVKNIWLSPTANEYVIANMHAENEKKIEEDISLYLMAPAYAREKIGISADDDEMKNQVKEKYNIDETSILKVYYIDYNKYSKVYADNEVLKYLISDEYYLAVPNDKYCRLYDMNGRLVNNEDDNHFYGMFTLTEKEFTFLKDNDKMFEALKELNDNEIEDIKFIVVNGQCNCLYIECKNSEYLLRTYIGTYTKPENYSVVYQWVKQLEPYKLYNAKYFFNTISDEMDVLDDDKSYFEEEANYLQNNGLLYGNEKGLDLLKPLTRIEATAILVRAMGYEDEPTSDTSYFADISSENWGAKYANIARDKGIAAGVGDDLFAPSDTITASQFATLILRNIGENPDWQTAINTFVERGLITSEQAEKMDLFTRGDMAKIIYEARQKNLL